MLAIFFSKKNVITKIAGSYPLAGCCPLVAIAMVADKKINGPAFSLRFAPFQLLLLSCPSAGGSGGEDCLDSM